MQLPPEELELLEEDAEQEMEAHEGVVIGGLGQELDLPKVEVAIVVNFRQVELEGGCIADVAVKGRIRAEVNLPGALKLD